jgi:hypothetical protein
MKVLYSTVATLLLASNGVDAFTAMKTPMTATSLKMVSFTLFLSSCCFHLEAGQKFHSGIFPRFHSGVFCVQPIS